MNKAIRAAVTGFGSCAIVFSVLSASPASAKSLRIGVVNMQRAISETNEGKSAESKLRRRKKQLEGSKDKPMKRNMPQEAISNLGRRYVHLILQNYQEERITLMDASDYLGVRAEKVRSVEDLATAW